MASRHDGSARAGAAAGSQNPLLARWDTPFEVPPFDAIGSDTFSGAFEQAMAENRAEIDAISASANEPTFANTIEALETSGEALTRVCSVFFALAGADTNDKLQQVERDISPKLAAHQNAIYLDAKLFARIDALFEARHSLKLEPEELRILERTHLAFVRSGAKLKPMAKKRIAEIGEQLAGLTTQFSQNVLKDEQSWHMELDGERDLEGLPPTLRAAAARTAKDLGLQAGHAITLARSSVEGFLQFSARRELRETAFKAWIRRGEMGGATDNRAIVAEIVALRLEMAKLLGYPTYAAYSLDDTMAKTPAAVRGLLDRVWPVAVRRAGEERDALQAVVQSEGGNFPIAPWDWRYYAEKVRKARFDLDDGEVRPYLQLDNMIAAAFDTATRLFGLAFEERPDLPRYHPDVRVWEVKDGGGKHVGIFMGDYFARPSKRSGAWMSSLRSQHRLGQGTQTAVSPVIYNVMNFARGADGEPPLLSFDDARTLFHEFGHGLHGLLSDVTFPSLSGTSVARDFVELPSQLYEHWLSRPEVLKRFAVHNKTGKSMPDSLLERLEAARVFNQGFATVEYTASALLDMDLHALEAADALDVTRFERDGLDKIGMPAEIVMRHRIPHFQHIMGGYAAGYYSYLWSEVMDADAFAAFTETGDIYDAKTAEKLKTYIYSAGNKRDAEEAYAAFRGRAPTVEGLLKQRGLV